jgi:hypothetical protein
MVFSSAARVSGGADGGACVQANWETSKARGASRTNHRFMSVFSIAGNRAGCPLMGEKYITRSAADAYEVCSSA